MKNKKNIYGLLIFILLMLTGIGYATISKVLTMEGTISTPGATAADLVVHFDETYFDENPSVKCGITLDTTKTIATIVTEDLAVVGDKAVAKLRIINGSVSLSALIEEVSCQLNDSQYDKYFKVTTSKIPENTKLVPNTTIAVEITIELICLPVEEKIAKFTVSYKATAKD